MSEIKQAIKLLKEFRDERDWKQFHNPKDLSVALSIEANELLELFLWKSEAELDTIEIERLKDEMADILSYAFLLVDHYNFDILELLERKIEINRKKYPISKSKGKATKYDRL